MKKIPYVVGKFSVDDWKYDLLFKDSEFILELKPNLVNRPIKTDWDRLFWDVPLIEDVDEKINAFSVINKSLEIMIPFIYRYGISYFYFTAATDRKGRIYTRLADRIVKELDGKFSWTKDGNSYYFWKG